MPFPDQIVQFQVYENISAQDANDISNLLYNITKNLNSTVLCSGPCIVSGLSFSVTAGSGSYTFTLNPGLAIFDITPDPNGYSGSIFYCGGPSGTPPTPAISGSFTPGPMYVYINYAESNGSKNGIGTTDYRDTINTSGVVQLNQLVYTRIISQYTISLTQVPAANLGILLCTFSLDASGPGMGGNGYSSGSVSSVIYQQPYMFEDQVFGGKNNGKTDHSPNASNSLADNLASIRSQLNEIIGSVTNHWYDQTPTGFDHVSSSSFTGSLNGITTEVSTLSNELKTTNTTVSDNFIGPTTNNNASLALAIVATNTNIGNMSQPAPGSWTTSGSAPNVYFTVSEALNYLYNHIILWGSNEVVYNTNGNFSFTIPSGVTRLKVKMWGAGGAGTGTNGVGSGGGYCEGTFTVVPGDSHNFTVGKGSTGGSAGGSSFMTDFGMAANGGNYTNSANTNVAGGTASGGSLQVQGGNAYSNGNMNIGGGTYAGAPCAIGDNSVGSVGSWPGGGSSRNNSGADGGVIFIH